MTAVNMRLQLITYMRSCFALYSKTRCTQQNLQAILKKVAKGLHLAVASSNQLLLVTGDEALARSARTLGIEVQLLIAVTES